MAMFDLPATAQPGKDVPVAQDELGRTVYRTFTGEQYTMPEPPRMAPKAAGPMQGPLAYASPQRMAEMRAYAEDLRGMQGSYSAEDMAAAGYSPMEIAALSTAKRSAMPFSQEADRDRQRAPADVLQEPDLTMRYKVTGLVQNALIEQVGMDTYNAGMYARRIMGDPNAAGILESLGLIDIASMLGGGGSLAVKGIGMTGRAVAAAPAALSGMFNVEEGTQTAQRGYQEGSALQTGLGAVQAVAGMAEMFPASKLIAEGIARNVSRMDPNTLFSVFGPPMPPQPLRAPDTGGGVGRPPVTFADAERAMQEAQPAIARPIDVNPNSLIFRESQQNRTSEVKEMFPEGEGYYPVVSIFDNGERTILDGHNRAAVAMERGDVIPTVDITKSEYDALVSVGFDDMEISYAALSRAKQDEAASSINQQFPGADIWKRGTEAEGILDDLNAVSQETPSIRAYQGSPHNFAAERLVRMPDGSTQYIVGKPDVLPDVPAGAEVLQDFPLGRMRMDKIGTGEGAQAYGYGLYGAENEGIARGYRDALTTPVDYRGQGYPGADTNLAAKKVADAMGPNSEPANVIASESSKYRYQAQQLRAGRENQSSAAREANERLAASFEKIADDIEALNPDDFRLNTGSMYELEVNANPEDFLDWDLPLSEQPKKVRDALANVDVRAGNMSAKDRAETISAALSGDPRLAHLLRDRTINATGDVVYKGMSDTLGAMDWPLGADAATRRQFYGQGAANASEALREAGIPGIRYLDAGSRGAGDGTRNYVIFDENLINIVRKYGIAGAATMLGVSAFDVEQALAENMSPSQWDQLVAGPQ